MSSIGIIANPASGKDIRRLVSYATTIDNFEKVNISKRIVLAAQAMGIDRIYFMPDSFRIGHQVGENLTCDGVCEVDIHVLDMPLTASLHDTVTAAKRMEELGIGCIVVLGGDGTSRAVAKGVSHTPILPLSTGTNNVYPDMLEGTVAGMAASAVAQMSDTSGCCIRDKRIDVYVNDKAVDIALIDAVLSDDIFAGAKAIWDYDGIKAVVVTRCHPASIGFSAIAGCAQIVRDTDEFGYYLRLSPNGPTFYRAPVAAGVLLNIGIEKEQTVAIDEWLHIDIKKHGMVALDGEREVKVKEGDRLSFCITRTGPLRVKSIEAVEQAMALGMYKIRG